MDAIEILRYPSCWNKFQPEPLNGPLFHGDSYGTLTCECGIFPVVNGIPVLDRRHNEHRLVALIKKGHSAQPLLNACPIASIAKSCATFMARPEASDRTRQAWSRLGRNTR